MTAKIAKIIMGLGFLSFFMVALGGLGYRFNLWDLGVGFGFFRTAPIVAIVGIVLAIVFVITQKVRNQSLQGLLAPMSISMAFALVALYFPLAMKSTAESLPFIHDITTDTDNPPAFVAVVPLREADPKTRNPHEYQGEEIAKQQKAGYPDLSTLFVEGSTADTFAKALQVTKSMGWDLVASVESEGRIEATASTFYFGFKDDVVIRIQETDGKTAIDLRSKSRVGKSDVGANAKRINKWLTAYKQL